MVVSETPVGELMEHDFLGCFSGNISLSNGTPEKVVLFSRSECSNGKYSCSISSKPSLIPISGFYLYMALICTNGKRDSGMKFTSREFCLLSAETVNRPECPLSGKQPIS